MSIESPGNAKDIFLAAIEIESAEDREQFLNMSCGSAGTLRRRVDALIAAHESPESLLNEAAPHVGKHTLPATIEHSVMERPGMQIGPFTLKERIGAGGMGVVWAAERTKPIRQKVAIKVIKPGMDSEQVLARFQAEQAALAMMDHPNIAKVIDAGTTDQGRPYFVMELIRGIPITEYCDAKRLNVRHRIELMTQTCRAVQHAHQKGIIHRDIKPSNVLVSEKDGEPLVKVIDFGVAKALHRSQPDVSVYSGLFQAIGTLAYMSPEQAGLSTDDVDTRADVYGLGVLLYELLTGVTPFDRRQLEKAAVDEAFRVIRETDPPKPSTKVSSSDERVVTASQQRGTDPRHLQRSLRGDLDTVVMKSIAKDRTQRYESSTALAADLRRFLNNEPVEACPPSFSYRLRKLWCANRLAISVSLLMLVVLSLATLITAKKSFDLTKAYESVRKSEDRAIVSAEEAQKAVKQAVAENLKQREVLYTLLMDSARDALDRGFVTRTREQLDSFIPNGDARDLRGFEWYSLDRKLHSGIGERIYEHSRQPMSLSVSDTGLMSIAMRGAVDLFDLKTGKVVHDSRLPSKRDNSIYLTTGERNYWSFMFACLSKDAELVAYPHPQNVDLLRVTNLSTKHSIDLDGHGQTVRCASFSQDKKTLVSGDHTGFVRIWDVQTGKLNKSKQLHKYLVWSVDVSPDGKWVASGGADNRIVLWSIDGDEEFVLEGHYDIPSTVEGVTSVDFSPDGDLLVSGGADRTVRVWDVSQQSLVTVLTGHTDEVRSVAFSPDGRSVASGGRDNVVRIWDIPERRLRAELRGLEATIRSIAFSPDGSRVLAGSADYSIMEWDARQDNVDTLWANRAITHVAVSDDGETVAAIQLDSDQVCVWQTQEGSSQKAKWNVELDDVGIAVALSSRGILATVDESGNVALWQSSADNTSKLDSFSAPSPRSKEGGIMDAEAFEFSRDGSTLAMGTGDGDVWVLDVSSRAIRTLKSEHGQVTDLVFSPDGSKLAAAYLNGPAYLWNVATNDFQVLLEDADRRTLDINSKGLLAIGGRNGVELFQLQSGRSDVYSVADEDWVEATFLDDRTLILSGEGIGQQIGDVSLWDLDRESVRFTFRGHTGSVECTAATPDGRVIVAGRWNGSISIWRR